MESEPSSAWHLAIIVVESRTTGEWYVSRKGEMAFEGSGGGKWVAEIVGDFCKSNNISVAGWVFPQEEIDLLTSGKIHWPLVKNKAIPLLSYAKSDHFVKYVVDSYKKIHK